MILNLKERIKNSKEPRYFEDGTKITADNAHLIDAELREFFRKNVFPYKYESSDGVNFNELFNELYAKWLHDTYEPDYVDRSIDRSIKGERSEYGETFLSLSISAGASIIGVDFPQDIRDTWYAIDDWHKSGELFSLKHLGNISFNAAMLLPLVGFVGSLKVVKKGEMCYIGREK